MTMSHGVPIFRQTHMGYPPFWGNPHILHVLTLQTNPWKSRTLSSDPSRLGCFRGFRRVRFRLLQVLLWDLKASALSSMNASWNIPKLDGNNGKNGGGYRKPLLPLIDEDWIMNINWICDTIITNCENWWRLNLRHHQKILSSIHKNWAASVPTIFPPGSSLRFQNFHGWCIDHPPSCQRCRRINPSKTGKQKPSTKTNIWCHLSFSVIVIIVIILIITYPFMVIHLCDLFFSINHPFMVPRCSKISSNHWGHMASPPVHSKLRGPRRTA